MQLKNQGEDVYQSPWDGFQKIIKHEGVAGLYKGIESKIVQSVLTSAFLFAFKEEFYSSAVFLLTASGARQEVPVVIKK